MTVDCAQPAQLANNHSSPLINEPEIDRILTMGWEAAARTNPMLLAVKTANALDQLSPADLLSPLPDKEILN